MTFLAQELILILFSAHLGLISLTAKLILRSFLAHRLDGQSSCWAHFWLIGLTAATHFEHVGSMSKARFGFILGWLCWCPKLVLGSFWAHRFDGQSSFWAQLRSFRSSSDVVLGSSVARLLGAKFLAQGGHPRIQIVSFLKLCESCRTPQKVVKDLGREFWKDSHRRLFQDLRREFWIWKGSGHAASTNRFFVEGLKASQGHPSVEIVSHKLDSELGPSLSGLSTCVWPMFLVPSSFAWPRQRAPEPWLEPGWWFQSLC